MDKEAGEGERAKLREQERMKERVRYENELEQQTQEKTMRAEMKADVEAQHELKCQAIRVDEDRKLAGRIAEKEREAATRALELKVAAITKDGEQAEILHQQRMDALISKDSLQMQQVTTNSDYQIANITQATTRRATRVFPISRSRPL